MKSKPGLRSLWIGGVFVVLMLCPSDGIAQEFAAATPHGKAGCPAGTFLDIGRGDCWSCPATYQRTVFFPVDSAKACERPASTVHQRATRHGRGTGLLGTDCPRGQFWDPNGYCYTCPSSYNRTAAPVTSAQACSRGVAAAYARATRSKSLGCPAGTFLDIGRGDCWSCPPQWHRTVAPVTAPRACARDLANVLTVDPTAMCTQVIAALRDGEQGVTRLMASIETVIDPVMKPARDALSKLHPRISTPAELDRMIDQLAGALRPYQAMIDEVQRLSGQLKTAGTQLQTLLLNPKAMCEGSIADIDRQLTALGLRPNLALRRSGRFDHWFLSTAHAATSGPAAVFAVTGETILPPPKPGPTVSLAVVTNFAGRGGLYVTPGLVSGSAPGGALSVAIYLFADADPASLAGELSKEISIGAGNTLDEFLKKAGRLQGAIPDGLILPLDELGCGVSKDLQTWGKGTGGVKVPELAGSFDHAFKMWSRP